MSQKLGKEVSFENGKVDRRFDSDWFESGMIRKDAIPDMVKGLVMQQKEMVKYIEALHDKIDWILEQNKCCDIPSCFTSNCTSDHK